jgi:hypothetical protein
MEGHRMTDKAHTLIKEYEKLKSDRMPFDSLWQELADYVYPNAADFTRLYGIGDKRRQYIYDSTAEHSLKIFASSIVGFLANPATRWFFLETDNPDINNKKENGLWLEKATDILLNAFNDPRAKFYGHLHTALLGVGAFGTAGMLIQEGVGANSSKLEFSAQNIRDLYIMEGHNGTVDTVYRPFKMTGHQLLEKRELRGWKLSEKTMEKISKDANCKIEMLHVIKPRIEKLGEIGPESMPFEGIYIECDSKTVVKEDGHLEFPIPVARWERTITEQYGRGPAQVALSDVKMVNAMQKALIVATEKQINPPMQMPNDGSFGMIDLSAAAINFYDPAMGGIEPIATIGNISIAQENINSIQDVIRRAFFVDQLQMVGKADMTATEVLQRQDEKGRLLAPSIGMIQAELIGPIINRAFSVLLNNGTIPTAPEDLRNQEIKIGYVSPLTRAQRSSEASSLLEFGQAAAGLAQVSPDSLDGIDFDEMIKKLHEINGISSKVLKDKKEVARIRQERQQAIQQQQALESAGQAADAAKKGKEAGVI